MPEIINEEELDNALERGFHLMQVDLIVDSVEYNELKELAIEIEKYESKHYPIGTTSDVDVIKFKLYMQ